MPNDNDLRDNKQMSNKEFNNRQRLMADYYKILQSMLSRQLADVLTDVYNVNEIKSLLDECIRREYIKKGFRSNELS